MKFEDAQLLLEKRLTYKSGYGISVHKNPYKASILVSIFMTEPDSNNPKREPGPVGSTYEIIFSDFRSMSEEEFLNRVYSQLFKMEEHSVKEWFRVDGKCFKDPHPEVTEKPYEVYK